MHGWSNWDWDMFNMHGVHWWNFSHLDLVVLDKGNLLGRQEVIEQVIIKAQSTFNPHPTLPTHITNTEIRHQHPAFYFKHGFCCFFSLNSHGNKDIPDCRNLMKPDWVGNLRWDNTEPYKPFRWVNTEPSVQFRKANTYSSMQFRKANTDPSMQLRWGHTELLFCEMLRKKLHESVRPLSHSQTSPGKSSCQDAFGESLCNALP